MITYRFADDSHIPQMTALWCGVFGDSPEYVQQFYAHWNGKGKFLIALDGEKAVGMIHLLPTVLVWRHKTYRAYYFYAGAVDPGYRSQGIYSKLNEHVRSICQKERAFIFLLPATAMLFRYYDRFGYQAVPFYSCITVQHRGSERLPALSMDELTASEFARMLETEENNLSGFIRWDTDALQYVIAEMQACGGFAKKFAADGTACAALGYCENGTLHLRSLAAPKELHEIIFQQLMQHYQCDTLVCRIPVCADSAVHCGMVLAPNGLCPEALFFPNDLS